jgi:hypothetical protein
MDFGALIPIRTQLPFTASTVTTTSWPIMTASAGRLVKMSI